MNNEMRDISFFDLVERPAFLVMDGVITRINQAARGLGLYPGFRAEELLDVEQTDFQIPREGSVFVSLKVGSNTVGASIQRFENGELYLLEDEGDMESLKALSLASVSLRAALSEVMVTTGSLSRSALNLNPDLSPQVHKTDKAVFQVLRLATNMADAYWLAKGMDLEKEPTNIGDFLDEIVEKVGALSESRGFHLILHPCPRIVVHANRQYLERAILNLLSNSMRYTHEGGTAEILVSETPRQCVIRIRDTGSGLDEEIRDALFTQYRRAPAIETGDRGLGLGLVITRSIASAHGGTLFIGPAPQGGTEAALSLSKRKPEKPVASSPLMDVDYAGEWDHTLLELAKELDYTAFAYL